MYIYPDNLKAKATMWLWGLKDLAIVGIIILFSVFAFAYAGVWFPLVIAGERHACRMPLDGGRFRCRSPFLFSGKNLKGRRICGGLF